MRSAVDAAAKSATGHATSPILRTPFQFARAAMVRSLSIRIYVCSTAADVAGHPPSKLPCQRRHRPTILFVTHSVFESVYLSTRIAVMSARPGRISADLRVDLAQPRNRATRISSEYAAMCDSVSAHLARAMEAR